MNENLEELMYWSGLTAQGSWDNLDKYDREAIEKFAKLVVESCAARVDWILAPGGQTQGDLIREYFGVVK